MKKFALLLMLCLLPWGALWAMTLEEALDDAARQLAQNKKIDRQDKLVVELVNYHSQAKDTQAKKIETTLYFALDKLGFKTVLLSESLTGVSSRTLFIKGTYQPEGDQVIVRLQVVKALKDGSVEDQVVVRYENKQKRKKTLVAVLDIESKDLKPVQRKAYSDIFRTALSDLDVFSIASSADIDKLNPDQIQQTTGCTRDECATIIGEQLGVERSISVSLFMISEKNIILSAKMFDIRDGAILVTKTVEHKGDLSTITDSIRALAQELAGRKEKLETAPQPEPVVAKPAAPAAVVESSSGGWLWHGVALTGLGFSVSQSKAAASKYNSLAQDNAALKKKYDAASTTAERKRLQTEYDANAEEMKTLKTRVQTMDSISVVMALWEGYLLYSGGMPWSNAQAEPATPGPHLAWQAIPGLELGLSLNWRF